jgi:hypothetical protein
MESFVSEVPAHPFVTFCAFCTKGVIKEDMIYEKGLVFHKDCFSKHGNDFPVVNHDLLSQNTNAKIQLIELKNLKARMMGSANSENPVSNPETSKTNTKKRRLKRALTKRTKSKKSKKQRARKSSKKKMKIGRLSRKSSLMTRKRRAKRKSTKRRTSRR